MAVKVLAFIPARGQSKGVPRKNLLALGGKPLIAWTIESALRADGISRVIVSTEDREVAKVAIDYGAEVPFLRPSNLAGDFADVSNALAYTQSRLGQEGYLPGAIITLFPTSPFRFQGLVDKLVEKTIAGFNVRTVKDVGWKGGRLYRANEKSYSEVFSKEQKDFFQPVGLFLSTNYGLPRQSSQWAELISDPIALIDIDTWADVQRAATVLRYNMFKFV